MSHTVELKPFFVEGTFHDSYEEMCHYVINQVNWKAGAEIDQGAPQELYGLRLQQRFFSGFRIHNSLNIAADAYVLEVKGGSYEVVTYEQMKSEDEPSLPTVSTHRLALDEQITIIEYAATSRGYAPVCCYIPVSFKPWEDVKYDRRLPRHLRADSRLREVGHRYFGVSQLSVLT